MDVSVEITGSLARRLTVIVPAAEISNAIHKRIQKLTKTIKLDGYRPGKVPTSVIQQRFGDAIKGEELEKLVQSSLTTALQQENLQPAGSPMIQSLEANEGQPLKYSATFEVYPDVQVNSLADVTLEKTVVTIEESDVDYVVEKMRKQHTGEGETLSDDEFIKRLSMETMDELRKQVRSHMEQELNNVLKNKLKTQLIDKLIEKNTLELPKTLLERECQHLEKEWEERLRQSTQQQDAVLPAEAKEKSLEIARRRVTLSLLFGELMKQYNIQVDNNKVNEHIFRIATSFQEPQAIVNMIQKQPEILNNIRAQVVEEQVVDKLLEQVQYTEKTAQYREIMQMETDAAGELEHEHHHEHEHEHVHDENCDHDH